MEKTEKVVGKTRQHPEEPLEEISLTAPQLLTTCARIPKDNLVVRFAGNFLKKYSGILPVNWFEYNDRFINGRPLNKLSSATLVSVHIHGISNIFPMYITSCICPLYECQFFIFLRLRQGFNRGA